MGFECWAFKSLSQILPNTQAFMKHNLFNYPAAFNYPKCRPNTWLFSPFSALDVYPFRSVCACGLLKLFLFPSSFPENSCQTDCAETHYISRVWLSCFQWITVPQIFFLLTHYNYIKDAFKHIILFLSKSEEMHVFYDSLSFILSQMQKKKILGCERGICKTITKQNQTEVTLKYRVILKRNKRMPGTYGSWLPQLEDRSLWS